MKNVFGFISGMVTLLVAIVSCVLIFIGKRLKKMPKEDKEFIKKELGSIDIPINKLADIASRIYAVCYDWILFGKKGDDCPSRLGWFYGDQPNYSHYSSSKYNTRWHRYFQFSPNGAVTRTSVERVLYKLRERADKYGSVKVKELFDISGDVMPYFYDGMGWTLDMLMSYDCKVLYSEKFGFYYMQLPKPIDISNEPFEDLDTEIHVIAEPYVGIPEEYDIEECTFDIHSNTLRDLDGEIMSTSDELIEVIKEGRKIFNEHLCVRDPINKVDYSIEIVENYWTYVQKNNK